MTDWTKLEIKGKLLGAHAYEEKARIMHAIGRDIKQLELDLTAVTDMDANGAQVLVDLHKTMLNRFGDLKLTHVPELVVLGLAQWQPHETLPIASKAPKAGAAHAVHHDHAAHSAAPLDPAARRRRRLVVLLSTCAVLAGASAGSYIYFNRMGVVPKPTSADQLRFAASNGRMVAAMATDYHRKLHRYPANADAVQMLVQEKRLPLLNPFNNMPLAIVGPGNSLPGALVYSSDGGGFTIRVLGADGQSTGKPLTGH